MEEKSGVQFPCVGSKDGGLLGVKEENIANKVFNTYKEASVLFKQGNFEAALNKYNQVISLGWDCPYDYMVSKTVNTSLEQKKKCQFRLLKF